MPPTTSTAPKAPLQGSPPPRDAPDATPRGPGRPRDEAASEAIFAAALRQVEELGYGCMSVESVAAEAGVSRASVYRRFRSKADLVTAAIARSIPPPDHGTAVGDPRRALVAYLEQFEDRFAESCLEVIGSLSGTREEPGALALHRERVVGPRLAYGRFLLELAQARGELAADADLDVALHMLAGSVLCHRVSGATPGPGWAERAVDAVWSGMAQSGLAQSGIDQSDMAPGTRPT